MSRSIHETLKSVVKSNKKNELTIDNPDVIKLAQKRKYKKMTISVRSKKTDIDKPR